MGLRLLIFSILLSYLSSNSAAEVIIVLPDGDIGLELRQCAITDDDYDNCKRYLKDLQAYAIRTLNVERFFLSRGERDKMPVATNMLHLEADHRLEENAQKYAEACVKEPGMEKCPLEGKNDDGEVIVFIKKHNIDTIISTGDIYSFAMDRIAREIMEWRNQISDINVLDLLDMVASYRTPQGEEGTLQNIAKLFHAYAWKVGCGIADTYINSNEFKEVIACFYGPPKLNNGDELYIPGCMPCSHCPEGSSCYSNERDPIKDVLCKPDSPDKTFHSSHRLGREKICYQVEKPVPGETKLEIPLDASENGVQECRGQRSCSPGWQKKEGYSSIEVKGQCTSAAIFGKEIHIPSESCFQFRYNKRTNTNTPCLNSEIISFAFQVSDTAKRIKAVKCEADSHYMYLNIPWTEVDINVGFGTRSLSDDNDYEIKVENFLVTNGKCPV